VPLRHKFAKGSCSKFFATNARDPLHWTQNSGFGAFRTVSLLHESWCKRAELVPWTHKFARQGHVRIFPNERTRSTPLDPKVMFWGVSDHFDTSRKSMQNVTNWWHYRTSSLHKVASEFFRNERTQSNPFDQKVMFCGVSDHFVTARKSMQNWPNWCHYRTSSVNKVALEFFATNTPDPLHLTQNSCFGSFRTVSLPYESWCKTCRTGAINVQVR
jgi:hypothetical protein